MVNKITHGWVTQTFDENTGELMEQQFFAGDEVEFEDMNGESLTVTENLQKLYHPFT
jgi:hypothetical protein